MTALGGRDVEGTLSAVRRDLTGFPGLKTHEADGEYCRDFPNVACLDRMGLDG